ncbi:unnamed protein product, partial [Staurois parvus]
MVPCIMSAVSGHLLYYVRSLRSSPVLCLQSPIISCIVSAVSGHLLYCVRSLWSSPTMYRLRISGHYACSLRHLLYCPQSGSSPVLCPQ